MARAPQTIAELRALYVAGKPLEAAAKELGVANGTARRWRQDALRRGDDWRAARDGIALPPVGVPAALAAIERLEARVGESGAATHRDFLEITVAASAEFDRHRDQARASPGLSCGPEPRRSGPRLDGFRRMSATAIEIFRPGTHTAMGGEELAFTAGDVEAIAASYDPETHQAPIVVGHPAHDLPAYGWVKGLAFKGGHLVAQLDQVDPAFRELVQAGRYKKISASFYRPDAPANPKPGKWYLRHVGFLGAQAPAVKGLKPAQFAADVGGVVEFSAESELSIILAARERRDRARAERIGCSAVAYQERMAGLGIVVTTADAVRHVKAGIEECSAKGAAIRAQIATLRANDAAFAENVAREAQAMIVGNPLMTLSEAVRRAETALAARLADGRTSGLEAADPLEIAGRAREHQARLAAMGVFIGAGEAVRQVLDGAAVA